MVGINGRMRDYNIAECDDHYVQSECKVLSHSKKIEIVENGDDGEDTTYYYVRCLGLFLRAS